MITFQAERLHDCLEEMKPLFPIHWQALGVFRDKMPLAPRYDEYLRRELDGQVMNMTVRKDGKIIAYYITFVAPGLHYGETLSSTMDITYVHPDYDKQGLIVRLMLKAEKELRSRGVQVWYTGSKISSTYHESMDRLVTKFGFKPVDLYYAKWIGE